jgi:hypothetical protein
MMGSLIAHDSPSHQFMVHCLKSASLDSEWFRLKWPDDRVQEVVQFERALRQSG